MFGYVEVRCGNVLSTSKVLMCHPPLLEDNPPVDDTNSERAAERYDKGIRDVGQDRSTVRQTMEGLLDGEETLVIKFIPKVLF
jgi:hypothetical protein